MEVEVVSTGQAANALKAISKTDDKLVVANYLALWNSRDLEGIASDRVNPDGSIGEHFSPHCEFESEYTKSIGRLPVDWEHGQDTDPESPGKDDVLGLWVQRVLNRRNRYVQMLEDLIEAGMIGTSSEAISEQVRKAADGEITVWPLRRDTLTVSPMEPRMLTDNQLAALKALAADIPQVVSAYKACGIDLLCSKGDGERDGGLSRQSRAQAAKARAQARLRLMSLSNS